VQPVLDHSCVECHDGSAEKGKAKPDLRPGAQGHFTKGYAALHPYVRRPGPESDYHIMPPADYAANTSELIQMLKKGHHGVALDDEAWQRLYTWIDLNVPDHGTWREFRNPGKPAERRLALRRLYTNMDDDPEAIPELPPPAFAKRPKPASGAGGAKGAVAAPPALAGWPMPADEAKKRQTAAGKSAERTLDLGDVKLPMVLIPAGEFVMGSNAGADDEAPAHVVKIEKPFWMGKVEITNEQFRLFDPSHDSRYISVFGKDQATRGLPVNGPQQPVVRVAWTRAAAFCRWLSEKTGESFSLPTEAQWECACRAGTATPMHYGAAESDYSKVANLADAALNLRAGWHVKDPFAKDGAVVSATVGRYAPNAWGVCDMHGNVAEWTASVYKPYPVRPGDGRELTGPQLAALADKPGEQWPAMVVRGGSWYDRAKRATSSFRLAYPAWQGVYNVGFRVVAPADAIASAVPAAAPPSQQTMRTHP
jgi:formylglycine-generating enzyme required for sulfatase activity